MIFSYLLTGLIIVVYMRLGVFKEPLPLGMFLIGIFFWPFILFAVLVKNLCEIEL